MNTNIVNIMFLCVPEIFFFTSIFIVFMFYLVQVFQVTVLSSNKNQSFLFFQILKFTTYIFFFTAILFVYQFSILKLINQPIFLFNSMICFDLFSSFFKFSIVLISGFIISASSAYFAKLKSYTVEYIIIFLIFVFSLTIGLSANDFLVFYVSVELQSLCVYILLIQCNSSDFRSIKSLIKYFFYSIVSSAFFLFGLGFIYFMYGSFNYMHLHILCSTNSVEFKNSFSFLFAQIFVFFIIFFKLGIFPFYDWVPTTYSYNTLPTVFAISTISKLFAFFTLIKFLFVFDCSGSYLLFIFYWIGILSICFGVFGALFQSELLKIIGYSAVAHMGYSFVILSFFDINSISISVFYFISYIFLSFSFFYSFSTTFRVNVSQKLDTNKWFPIRFIFELNGLARSNWVLALFFAVTFFSFSGIPPFLGFYTKYFIFYYLIQHNYFFTFFFLFFMSILSTYYYLAIIVAIYFKDSVLNNSKFVSFNLFMLILFIVVNCFSIFGVDYLFNFILSFFLCRITWFLLNLAFLRLEFMLNKSIKFMVLLLVVSLNETLTQIFLLDLILKNFVIICLMYWLIRLLFMILLNLHIMHGISKYYIYSARLNVYEELRLLNFIKRVDISDLLNVEYFTDGFFNIKFYGFCISKTYKGVGSSFQISDKLSLKQRFFIFSPYLLKITIFTRKFKKHYSLT